MESNFKKDTNKLIYKIKADLEISKTRSKSIRTVDSPWTKKKHMQIKQSDFLIFPGWVTQKQLYHPNSYKNMGGAESIDNPLFHILLFE